MLNTLLDSGVNYIDTAPCYGESEETLGKYISHRRDEYWLTSKCGHAAGDVTAPEWTAAAVTQGIDQSLRRMQTDHLDLVHIHTCEVDVLRQGDVVRALQDAQRNGKTRYIGYSGDNDAALEAIGMGVFATLLTSFNVVDQSALDEILPAAEAAGMGIIAKRPIANAAFNRPPRPTAMPTSTGGARRISRCRKARRRTAWRWLCVSAIRSTTSIPPLSASTVWTNSQAILSR